VTAWLFDVYPHPRRSALVVWVKHGSTTTRRLVPYRPSFSVASDQEPLEVAERLLRDDARVARTWRGRTRLWLRGPLHEVLRVQPKRFQDTWGIATDLRKKTRTKGFLFLDVDHAQESRWMHSEGLWSMCRLDVRDAGVNGTRGGADDKVGGGGDVVGVGHVGVVGDDGGGDGGGDDVDSDAVASFAEHGRPHLARREFVGACVEQKRRLKPKT